MGIAAKRVKGGFQVEQKVDVVEGILFGSKMGTVVEGANVNINQDLGTVKGDVTAAEVDEL